MLHQTQDKANQGGNICTSLPTLRGLLDGMNH